MTFRFTFATLIILLAASFPALASPQMEDKSIVILRTIDKVSARTQTFDIPVDKTVKFGASLFIKARACRKSTPIEKPESAAFLQIWERKPDQEKPSWVFSGWMFASNPSLSAMDHPVYDVWVIDCKDDDSTTKSQEFSTEATPKGAPIRTDDNPVKDESPDKEETEIDPGGD